MQGNFIVITFFWKQAFVDDVKEKLEKNKNYNYCDLIITVCRKKETTKSACDLLFPHESSAH